MRSPIALPMALGALMTLVSAVALVPGCDLVKREEVRRVDAPGGKLQAVLVRTAIADSGPSDYDVIVVEKGRRPWLGTEVVFLAGARRQPLLEWNAEGHLRVAHGAVTRRELERAEVEIAEQTVYVSLIRQWRASPSAEALPASTEPE